MQKLAATGGTGWLVCCRKAHGLPDKRCRNKWQLQAVVPEGARAHRRTQYEHFPNTDLLAECVPVVNRREAVGLFQCGRSENEATCVKADSKWKLWVGALGLRRRHRIVIKFSKPFSTLLEYFQKSYWSSNHVAINGRFRYICFRL
jgi:hypothetical protein